MQPFHISLPCLDVEETREFYMNKLGRTSGRRAAVWTDIDFFGHQLTFVLSSNFKFPVKHYGFNDSVLPIFHFGAVLERDEWNRMLKQVEELDLLTIKPIRFLEGEVGEHESFFVEDPNNYLLEFKCFKARSEIFRNT